MRKKAHTRIKPHAIYDVDEEGFLCQLCQMEDEDKRWVYEPWEIVKHLKKFHKINRNEQIIPDWNVKFEKIYQENKKKSITLDPMQTGEIFVDETPEKEYEREKERRQIETKASREALS